MCILCWGVIPELREVSASIKAERAADGERLRLLEAAREREVVQTARLLVELEEARRLVAKLKQEAKR